MNGRPSPAQVTSPSVGASPIPRGEFVELGGEQYYRIAAYHRLPPFLMSVPSGTDLWMFLASEGGLTAGRVDADGSLFPYCTVDELHDAHHHTGPVSVLHVRDMDGGERRWEPFTPGSAEDENVERSLYKSLAGNHVVFEELHRELGLRFRYRWAASDEFGWVRTVAVENLGESETQLRILDGVRNVLPHGAPLALYQQSGNLVDAYKRSEIDEESGLGIYSLSSRITDRAEAREVLRANVVWSCGLENPRTHLSLDALTAFRDGALVSAENSLDGKRGNYLVSSTLTLEPGESTSWHLVLESARDHSQISQLRRELARGEGLRERIELSLHSADEELRRNVASADGLQLTGHTEAWWHHFANVLFNNMRGGVFLENHQVPVADLADFLKTRNREVALRQAELLGALPESVHIDELVERAQAADDPSFERLCLEYLPLYFSRRHGDPSRPWNHFSIRTTNGEGEAQLNYEGNWRDIFQNWEALGRSFPAFLPSMVAKFVNASTVDGFNPYRITRDGVDWERITPEDPWSNIGYWGDHQIIYLLKLLETTESLRPGTIHTMLGRDIFSYAEVPYRIRPFEELVEDPRSTIVFDDDLEAQIEERVARQGSDGRLLLDTEGSVRHVNLLEKLLVPVLSKLSNLVPGAGIWMNTQRPEWNDANNALAGGGISVVTLCYLRRHLAFLEEILASASAEALPVSSEVVDWFLTLQDAFELETTSRRTLFEELGQAFCGYRGKVYATGLGERRALELDQVIAFLGRARSVVDAGITANRREDGLYHTYHRADFEGQVNGETQGTNEAQEIELVHLPEMLEGQVAVLSSGHLSARDSLELLRALFSSRLYREAERSFLLYPERRLPGFLQKNSVPEGRVESIPLLRDLLAAGDTSLVVRDAAGVVRFQADIESTDDLDHSMDRLAEHRTWREAVASDRGSVDDLYDEVFGHNAYTGRSGVMYGYEGLGCIYWHMVAKLLLAVQECCDAAVDEPRELQDDLARMYFRVRAGIGYEKSVSEFGAFPTDPYSHTPSAGGARQPGMTGQVKEEILTRAGELGLRAVDGELRFSPTLLRRAELLDEPREFEYFDVAGQRRAIDLPQDSLAFTLCQVPVVYKAVKGEPFVQVRFPNGAEMKNPGQNLGRRLSDSVLSRDGQVQQILVGIPFSALR